ncbi:putative ribonuclease H-like domain-containing protein [Tanacetum coccineum]
MIKTARKRFKDLGQKTKSKDNDKGSRSKITKHEGTSLQRIQRPRPQDLNDNAISLISTKECHINSTSGEAKFDEKVIEGFICWDIPLSSKAFRVYNTRTRRVEENLHIGFLENKPMIEGNGTISNESADASYFDSPCKDVGNGEPKSVFDDKKQVEDGPHNESDEKDKSEDDSSPKEVNAAGQHVNTASLEVNTSRFKLNIVDPSVNTASLNDQDSPKDKFKLGASHTLEATHVEFFSDEDEPEVDLGTSLNSVSLNPQALLKLYLIHLRWKQCRKNFCNSNSNRVIDKNKSAFLYGTIKEEVYVTQLPGFKDPDHPDKVYKVVKALYGLHQASKAWITSITQKEDGIFISQDKYVAEILKKFNYTDVKSASTPVDLEKPLVKDGDADDVDVHLYRSMIGSLMYLTASRLDIMFAVCACARFQVTPKTSYILAIKRIFRYLKGKPTLGLWYSRDSPFELVAYTDSDYAGATQDRKSTTGGCQFLGNRLISWQCKKQTVVATSTTEAEYVAAASCCGQVLWIQNQLLDYGYNFMNTVINIDNNSTICIIENPVQHSKTKHIEIRHHFIRDCNAKKLIQMVKIHTDYNVADLLTKGFDAGRHVKRGRDTKIPQSSGPPIKVGDEAVHKELGDRMERASTTASSLEAEQDSGSGPRCQDTILGDVDAQTRFETTSK